MNTMKKHATKGFTQFDLTKQLLNKLSQFNLTPTAKLVLMYLTDCYNPKKAYMFPKQKTIAQKLGVSEASVIRAISELHKEGLIISERKYTRLYIFTSNFLSSLGISNKNMQVENSQNESEKTCNLQPVYKEQKKELNKTTKVDDFKILKEYAIRHKAENINAYINTLKINGSADKIIYEHKAKLRADLRAEREIEQSRIKCYEFEQLKKTAVPPPISAKKMRELLGG